MSLSIKPCQKFNIIKTQLDTENAVTYMSLRKSGCPSKSAMHFCKKMLCRNDSTKIKDGPTNFRILKLRKESELQINVRFIYIPFQ